MERILQRAAVRRGIEKFEQTHTNFVDHPVTLSVENEPAFLDAYAVELANGRILSITEKVGKVFPFFVDVDFDVQWLIGGVLDEGGLFDTVQDILTALSAAITNLTGVEGLADPVIALRCAYKAHIHYPTVFVDKAKAKAILQEAVLTLQSLRPQIDWNKVLDHMPYSSGLRMLGSVKGVMKNAVSREAEENLHKRAGLSTPHSQRYTIVDLDCKGRTYTPLAVTREHLDLVSIRKSGEVIKFSALSTAATSSRPLVRGPAKCVDHPLREKVMRYLREIQHRFPKNFDCLTVTALKELDSGSISVTFGCEDCPFRQIPHRRTEEGRRPTVFLLIRPPDKGPTQLRCYDCDSENRARIIPSPYPGTLFPALDIGEKVRRVLDQATCERVCNFVMEELGDNFASSPAGTGYKWYHFDPECQRWVQQERVVLAIMGEDGPVQSCLKAYKYSRPREPPLEDDEAAKTGKAVTRRKPPVDGDVESIIWCTQTTSYVHGSLLPILARKYDLKWRSDNKTFEEQLDDNPDLLCCSNGVYDLRNRVFRPGRPDDMLSMCTHVPYNPYERYPEEVRTSLAEYLRCVFTKEEHLDYFMRELGAALRGTLSRQQFFILTGRGANGKSTLMLLKSLSLGDYSGEVPVTMFTQHRGATEDATPVLMSMRGKRIVDTTEPESSTPFLMGSIKPLTGGDKITGRRLKENSVSFYLQCTIFCQTNDIPPIKATRNGTV